MRAVFYSTLLLAAAASGYAVETAVPTSYPAERYASMREKSPFALATPAVAAAAPKQAPFTQNLMLGGLSKVVIGGEDMYWASFYHVDKTIHFSLEGNEPNDEGISIASVEKAENPTETKVMLKKGDEFGAVGYDKAALTAAPAQPAQPSPEGRPGGRMKPANAAPGSLQPRSSANNRIQIPRPNVAPQANVVPAPGGHAPGMQAPGAPQPPANTARRVRVITSRP